MAARLFELFDHLNLVAGDVLFIQQINVLDATIIEHKVVNIVVVNLAGFLDDAITGLVQPGFDKAQPFAVIELYVIERLQLHAHIGQQHLGRIQIETIFIALILQILNELPLQIVFALVALGYFPFPGVFIQNDKVVRFGNGLGVINHFVLPVAKTHSCFSSDQATT